MQAFARSSAITGVVLCATVGCPQLKEDDFEPVLDGDAGATSGSAGTGGVGGNAGGAACDVADGCDADAGRGGAASGAGGSAGAGTAGAGGSQPTVGCGPDEIIAPNGVCYFIDTTTRTWAEARSSCQARGSSWDLVTIYDTARNDFVLSVTGFEAWIGATDAADEGAWVWVDAEAPFYEVGATTNVGFANWTAGEPNDYDGSDCLRMLATGQWADWPCDSLLGHVCRRTPP